MATLADFLRSFKSPELIKYFGIGSISLPDDIPWNGPAKLRTDRLQTVVDELGAEVLETIQDDAECIAFMSDEAGQNALYSVTDQHDVLDACDSSQARALWLLLNASDQFARAEEARFADERRLGRQWSRYIGPKNVAVHRSGPAHEALSQAVSTYFSSKRVLIEICDRTRLDDDTTRKLLQIAIYRETRKEMRRQFVDEHLDRTPDRPVVEAAITYEPHSDLIEAVASNKMDRLRLAQMFCEHLMEQPLSGERVRIRRFDLDVLRTPFKFLTDPEDQIEQVQLKYLRLIPYGVPGERITLECMKDATRDIWQMSAQQFGANDPLQRGHRITCAKFNVQFRSKGQHGKRTLPVTVTMPEGCDLRDGTRREQLIGRKYLARWGLVAET